MSLHELLLAATGVALSGNVFQAVALAKEKIKSKNDPAVIDELTKLRAERDDFVRINDGLLFERFEQLRPELIKFMKNHANLVPVSALEGFQPTDDQIRDWVVRNVGRLPLEFRNSLLELIKPEKHDWELIFKSKHGDTVSSKNISLTDFVEKCKKCSMIHRYTAPVGTTYDGFFFGADRTTDRGCRG